MAYKLDSTKAEIRLLTNDAFFWLKDEEDPIDEENLEEAHEILSMFPNGFVIQDNWKYVDDDTIEATFIPYVEDINVVWDGEARSPVAKGYIDQWPFMFKIINQYKCYARWYNENNGRVLLDCECEVVYIYNNPWAITPKGSQIPLWGKNVKYFTKNRFIPVS